MTPEPYLIFGGIEIANAARTHKYLQAMNPGPWRVSNACNCSAMGTDFVSPASDPAPWYVADYPDSANFLGLLIDTFDITTPTSRAATQNPGGQRFGRQKMNGRTFQISGILVATNAQGMAYGKRWLSEALIAPNGDCADCDLYDLCFLPVCPTAGAITDYFRTAHRCALIDGPIFAGEDSANQGFITRVSFQISSESAYLHSNSRNVITDQVLAFDTRHRVSVSVPAWPNDTALQFALTAGSPDPVSGVKMQLLPNGANCALPLDTTSLQLAARRYSGSGNWLDTHSGFNAVPNGGLVFLPERAEGKYIYFPGVSGNYIISARSLNTQDPTVPSTDTMYGVRMHIRMNDWTPATAVGLMEKNAGTDWYLQLTAAGKLAMTYGSPAGSYTLTTATAMPFTNGNAYWIKVDGGIVGGICLFKVQWSVDGVTWTTHDFQQVSMGFGSYPNATYNSTGPITVGRCTAVANYANMEFYEALIDGNPWIDNGGFPAELSAAIYWPLMHLVIDDTTVLDPFDTVIEPNSGNFTVFRSASGYFTTYVEASKFMLDGSNDYFETADAASLDLTAAQSGTAMIVYRPRSITTVQALLSKKQSHSAADVGWALRINTSNIDAMISDGTNQTSDPEPSAAIGKLTIVGLVRDVVADKVSAVVDGTQTALTTDATTGTIANAMTLRIGRLSGSGSAYFRGEVYAMGFWQLALNRSQIQQAASELLGFHSWDDDLLPCAEWIIDELPPGSVATVDGVSGRIIVTEQSSGKILDSIGAFDYGVSRSPFWPVVSFCANACVVIDTRDATFNANTKVSVAAEDRDL